MGSDVDNPHESASAGSQGDQQRDNDNKSPLSNVQQERLWIRYRTEYRDRESNEVVWEKDSPTPIDDSPERINSAKDPIFEIVTKYIARADYTSPKRSSQVGKDQTDNAPPRSFATPASYQIRIYSPAIRNALNSVVQYYPSQSLSGDVVEVNWPYPVLVHHYDELLQFREHVLLKGASDLCDREVHAGKDIQALLSYLDQTVMTHVKAEMLRLERGCYSFEHLWYSYKPGTAILEKCMENSIWEAAVISSVSGGTFVDPPELWTIHSWSLAFNGLYLDRVYQSSKVLKFSGEYSFDKETRFIPDTTNIKDEHAIQLIQQGKAYWDLVQKQCKYHDGTSHIFPYNKASHLTREIQSVEGCLGIRPSSCPGQYFARASTLLVGLINAFQVEGLVMTDMQEYYTANPSEKPEFLNSSDLRKWVSDCTCNVCRKSTKLETGAKSILEQYNMTTRFDSPQLSDHRCLLCPFEIPAFVFKTRTWDKFHVRNFSEPQFKQQMIDTLVTDEDRVVTLKALAQSFIRVNQAHNTIERPAWTADFVKGKGNGTTFLLHGRPGVGKTYTAECIAEYTKRPLMTLTSSDIGTNPSVVELNLTRHFKTAKSWGAILLIDEADVFMERRSTNDLTRNSLVAGFLRALEFYDGLLFLTTNRIGAFDDAFISRVHVQLYYRDFNDHERQRVWNTFIDKLDKDSKDSESGKAYMRVHISAKEYITGEDIRAIKWNGREIRNAFQTAVALAEHENKQDSEGTILVTDRHLKSILALSKDFKNYLTALHDGRDEAKRAEVRREWLGDLENVPEPRKRA